MEFRFLEAHANSGSVVRTGLTSRNDDNGWPDNDMEVLRRAYRPAGEWHTYEITCRGERMSVVLNGETVTACTGIKNLTGHIGIQGEHGLLEFRRMEGRKLQP